MMKIKMKLFGWLLSRAEIYQMTFDKEKWKLIETDSLIVVVEKDYKPKEDKGTCWADNEPYYTVGDE